MGPIQTQVADYEARKAARRAAVALRVSNAAPTVQTSSSAGSEPSSAAAPAVTALSRQEPVATDGPDGTPSYFDDYGVQDAAVNATRVTFSSPLTFSNVSMAAGGDILANTVGQVVRISDLTSAVLSAPAILALLAPEDVMLIKTFDSSGLAAHSLPTSLEQAVLPTTDVTQLLLLLESYYRASSNSMGIGGSTPSVDLQLQQSAVGIASADNSTNAMPSMRTNATAVPTVTAQSTPTTLTNVTAISSPPPSPDVSPPVKAASSPVSVSAPAVALPPSSSASPLLAPCFTTGVASLVAVGALVLSMF
ncbi:MAG: hypothetical protein WDW38_004200 [Sanguina aurantia]